MIPRKERCAVVAFTTLFAGCGLWGDPSQMMQAPDAGQPNMAGPCSNGRIIAGNITPLGFAPRFVRVLSQDLRTRSWFGVTAEQGLRGLFIEMQMKCPGARRAVSQAACCALRAGA